MSIYKFQDEVVTRIRSSRMGTVRCSGHLGEGECLPGGSAQVDLPPGGVCPGVCVCSRVSAWVCVAAGVSARGWCTPPVDRMTDTCDNITFLQLLLQMVKMTILSLQVGNG